MDPILRRRLIGAAVLWAGAMVLVPWVLERKPVSTESPALVAGGDSGREMRTIELAPPTPVQSSRRDTAEIPAPAAPSTPEPPPDEDVAGSAVPEPPPPPAPKTTQAPAEAAVKPSAPAAVAPPPPSVSAPAAAPKPAAAPVRNNPAPAAPAKPAPAAAPVAVAGWTVQVGSFGDLQNAQSLAARLLQRQHSAQVSTLVVDGRTLYRVRVGQLARREDAETLRSQIEQSMGLNGRVVPTP